MAREKVNRFRFSVIDDQTHKQLWVRRFTRLSLFVAGISAIVGICAVLWCLVAYTPLRTFIPGYPDAHSKRAAVRNAMRADSLETVIRSWELYTENLARVLDGETVVRIDSVVRQEPLPEPDAALLKEAQLKDSLLRATVAQTERFELSRRETRALPIEGLHFFTPVKGGVIREPFTANVHEYLDVTVPEASPVMAVLDGTVVFAGWSDATGYTIAIQHEGDILSIFQHNQKLLRRRGERVRAGTPVALAGHSGSVRQESHLHFELWYKGKAVDPASYMKF